MDTALMQIQKQVSERQCNVSNVFLMYLDLSGVASIVKVPVSAGPQFMPGQRDRPGVHMYRIQPAG